MPAQFSWAWLGVTPFFIFALMFLILPTAYLVIGGFQDADGNFTLNNIRDLFEPSILSAYWISIEISVASAVGGAIIGFFLAAVNGRWSGIHAGWTYLVPIGFVGAYTTFSTYEYEMAKLMEAGQWGRLGAYFMLSNAVGFAAVVAGMWFGKRA